MTMKFALILLSLSVLNISFAADHALDEIEVETIQGNKDERTFIETNESVSVLKPKSLNRSDLNNSVQMLNGLGNVQTTSDKNGDTFSIRGISDMGVTGFQKDNLASVLVDEVFQTGLALKAGSFENWDLQNVEVLRGAQSTSQGVNSLAGNILLFHARAHEENEGAAKLTLGNYSRKEGAFLVNRKINDKFALRLGYNKEYTDGYITNETNNNDKWGQRNKDHFSGDMLYKISANDELRFNFKVMRMHQGGSYVQGSDPWDYKVFEDQDFNSITNNFQTSLIYDKRLSGRLTNKTILAYSQATNTTKSDADGRATNLAGVRNDNENDSFMSFENQLRYNSENIKNVFGIHLHRYELHSDYDFGLVMGAPTVVPVIQENNRTRETYAIFDSITFDFDRHHSLNLGGRLETVTNDYGTQIASSIKNVDEDDAVTNFVALPKIGYNYRNGNYSLGALYSQGYRTGGVTVNRWRGTVNNYDPEKTDNYELSYKYVKRNFLVMSNVFYTKWRDQQVDVKLSNTLDTQIQNAANAELYGAEVETSYEFENDDSFRFNLGYVKTQFLNLKNNNRNYTGNEFPDAANFTGQASYWKFFSEKWKGILVARYVGKSYSDAENLRKSPAQFYMDTNVQYTFSSYLLELYVRNIFNQEYRVYNGVALANVNDYPASYHRMSPPREFGARLNYYW